MGRLNSTQFTMWCLSFLTSLSFLPDIFAYAPSIGRGTVAFGIQVLHDYVCLLFPVLVLTNVYEKCLWTRIRNMQTINVLYTMVMACFSYHKRCFLTLWYNDLLGLDRCKRYIPVWQRLINYASDAIRYDSSSTCTTMGIDNDYRNTYLWLNDQILFSLLIMCMNIYEYMQTVSRISPDVPNNEPADDDIITDSGKTQKK